jgi:hypothetical protein
MANLLMNLHSNSFQKIIKSRPPRAHEDIKNATARGLITKKEML